MISSEKEVVPFIDKICPANAKVIYFFFSIVILNYSFA